MRSPTPLRALPLLLALLCACDQDSGKPAVGATPSGATAPAASTPPPPPDPPRAPDIVLDGTNVSVGNERVAAGETGLPDRVGSLLAGRPMIAGNTVSIVALRAVRPSHVAAVVTALRQAKAAGVVVRTEARDGTTQKLQVTFATGAPDCATVAWLAKDASIDVWPAGGGPARRVVKGLAGPDMTLGSEAVGRQLGACSSGSQLFIGSDDALTWGLVFDLATTVLTPSARASSAVLVTGVVPGRKLTF